MKTRAWDGERFRDDYVVMPDGSVCRVGGYEMCYSHHPVDWTLSRFTGYSDITGKEAWEGDAFYYCESLRVIEWNDEYPGFIAKPVGKRNSRGDKPAFIVEGCEIVGNVFLNPELLEVVPRNHLKTPCVLVSNVRNDSNKKPDT